MEEKTCNQILAILDVLPIDAYDKVPAELIKKFEANKDENYTFKYDINKSINEQEITDETKELYAYLYEKYLASNEDISKFKKQEDELNEIYDGMKSSGDNIFEKNSEENISVDKDKQIVIRAVESDTNIFKKLFNGIRNMFKKK